MGTFFFIMILFMIGICFGIPFLPHSKPVPASAEIIVFFMTLGSVFLLLSVWYYTYYEIENETLTCRSGPFLKKIKISAIRKISRPQKIYIKKSYVSFGLSFVQTIITYNSYDDVAISPEDFDGFVNAIKLRNPDVEVV